MSCNRVGQAVLCAAFVVRLLIGNMGELSANDGIQPSLRLDIRQAYEANTAPGAGTPVFHRTSQGKLVLIRSTLERLSNSLSSDDEGRTWHTWDGGGTWPKMNYSDVVRLGDELLAFGHNTNDGYTGTYLWRSADEGKTWTGGKRLTDDADRWSPMNNRVLVMENRRLLVPIEQLLGEEGPGPNQVGTIFSDDGGRSWRRSPTFGPPPPLPDRPEGFGEPSVVELADGRLWMVFRTRFGHLWQAWSTDGGATWGEPTATALVSPMSAVNAKRLPGSNAVVVFWNNATPGESVGFVAGASIYGPRSPLVFAISNDNCLTWSKPVVVDKGTAAYPSLCFSDIEMFACYWSDPDPNQVVWANPNSHLMVVAYDLESLLPAAK